MIGTAGKLFLAYKKNKNVILSKQAKLLERITFLLVTLIFYSLLYFFKTSMYNFSDIWMILI